VGGLPAARAPGKGGGQRLGPSARLRLLEEIADHGRPRRAGRRDLRDVLERHPADGHHWRVGAGADGRERLTRGATSSAFER
jgi:hypothetical protein